MLCKYIYNLFLACTVRLCTNYSKNIEAKSEVVNREISRYYM